MSGRLKWTAGISLALSILGCDGERGMVPTKAVTVRENGSLELNLMTYNVRYENPKERASRAWKQRVIGSVKMIAREKPDVLGVQEALHGQAADFLASLPDYEFFGVGRSDGKKAGEYSGIFYQRKRFLIDESDCGTFWLSDTPERIGSKSWGNEIPRVAVWVRLVDRQSGRGFYVYNTHWDHRNQPSRERSAVLISSRIDIRKHADEPVALIGDFNSMENNPSLVYLTGRQVTVAGKKQQWPNGLIDTYQTLHPNEKNRRTLHFWSGRRDGLKVDHILVSRGANIVAAEIISQDRPEISDHFPVSARVVFPKGNLR